MQQTGFSIKKSPVLAEIFYEFAFERPPDLDLLNPRPNQQMCGHICGLSELLIHDLIILMRHPVTVELETHIAHSVLLDLAPGIEALVV